MMAVVRTIDWVGFKEWRDSRPRCIQELIDKLPPDRLYRLTSTNHRCTLYSYHEDGTVTVHITGEFNAVSFSRRVFGIKPEELVECDAPAPDEPLGDMCELSGIPAEKVAAAVFEHAKRQQAAESN